MQVQNSTNTNFQGGFRFRNLKPSAKIELPQIFNKGKQIFYDFENKGDVFLLTRSDKDYNVAKFIRKHKLNFEYYPELSTKTRKLDAEIHEPLTEMLNELKPEKITDFQEMMFTIKNKLRTENLAKAGINIDIKPERIEADSKILAKVNIDIPKAKHVMKDGLHMLTGANGEKAFVSAPSKNGF